MSIFCTFSIGTGVEFGMMLIKETICVEFTYTFFQNDQNEPILVLETTGDVLQVRTGSTYIYS